MPRVVRNYQVQDFSYLLAPTEENIQQKEPEKGRGNEVSEEKRRRDRLMSDRQMRYVLYRNQLHDRDCVRVAKIPDKEFVMCTDIPESANICPICFRRVIVRQAFCDNMSKYVTLAVRILDRLGATNRDLQMLFRESKAKLIAIDKDNLHFQIGEECWWVEAIENRCRLYHNNYTLLSPETRFFEQGYHLQSIGVLPFYRAVRTMCQYTWEGHLRWAKIKEQSQKKIQLRNRLSTVENIVRLSRFSLLYRYYRAVDIDGYLQQRIKNEKLPVRILKVQEKNAFEHITMRVKRRDSITVQNLAESAKEYGVQQLCEEYVSVCAENAKSQLAEYE